MSANVVPTLDAPLDFDALRERYRIERERRTPGESDRRYHDANDEFARFGADPNEREITREPIADAVDVLIVGGGFGGLLNAARLKEAGVEKVRIVEAASDVGGTWYWNRYPGAACDVESYVYFPLLEETGYMPVERYSKAAEIREHCQRIADHFGIYDDAVFSTRVTGLQWDAKAARWIVRTNHGDCMSARFVVLTTGPLNLPKLPAIPGVETFKGHSFHTSRWDYDYTGGSAIEPLDDLFDKRVGIIGTGATAIQCVPPLARSAKHLYVFQRTPSSVDARNNSPTDPEWAAKLKPGWQQERIESFTAQIAGDLTKDDLVADGWTVLARALRKKYAEDPERFDFPVMLEKADFEKMVQIRERIGKIVTDPATAAALQPWFSLFCKRPCFHDEYLQAFNGDNVTLVDSRGQGVERITEDGIVVQGTEYPVDCLIYATGFEVGSDYSKRAGFELRGVDGITLTAKWADGMETFHGLHSRGFPNCFVVSQAQSGMSANFPHMLNEQAIHIAHIVDQCVENGIRTIEASAAAEAAWVQTIIDHGQPRIDFLKACTPGYYNNEGRIADAAAKNLPYGPGPLAFVELLREWRAKGDMAGLEIDGAHALAQQPETVI